MLDAARWVSIVGPPGSGKTLLARHVAATAPLPVWVDAQRLGDTDRVLEACLAALAVERGPGDSARQALARAIDGRDALVVLDGVSEVPGLGDLLADLLAETNGPRFAVTSAWGLGHAAERVVRIGPLPLPAADRPLDGPALELCLARVASAGGRAVDLDSDGDALRRLLLATGGLPLLIEQLAVQVALVGVANTVPAPSLAEAVSATYALLDEGQQRCFRRLGHMPAPVGLDVVAQVAEVSRDQAASIAAALARRSLVEVGPDGRITLLAPMRQFAISLSGGTDDQSRAREGLLRWAEQVTPDDPLVGAADETWLGDVPLVRSAIEVACARDETRARGYALANQVFPALYTAMRFREASEILEGVLNSGAGPPDIGAQVARRAGIATSEARGTYEGLWLLDRAEEHARTAPDPDLESARNLSIRAEMHLDAGDLARALADAQRATELGARDSYVLRQARRTIVDVHVSRGAFREAQRVAEMVMTGAPPEERWLALSARVLLGRIALEQGRPLEAAAAARAAYAESVEIGEDRIALLAETLARQLDPTVPASGVDRESLPWAVRLVVLCQDARDLLTAGDLKRAAGLAADVVVLADSCRLGRDSVDARLLLGYALMASGEDDQATTTLLSALDHAVRHTLPLRAADALDALAVIGRRRGGSWVSWARGCAAAARQVRGARYAVAWGGPPAAAVDPAGRPAPEDWVADGDVTPACVEAVAAALARGQQPPRSSADRLTKAELAVARQVASGLTTRQIAEALFVSPRTVDAHLSHIFRKLGITTRARLAAIMTDYG